MLDKNDKKHHPRIGACSIEGCGKAITARGLCGAHYQKWRTLGSPLTGSTRGPNGSGYIDNSGYHRRHADGKQKPEHVRIVEKAIGREVLQKTPVHHVDRNRSNNANTNLVLCNSHAYHFLLHMRMRAFEATGNADSRKCCRCGKYDSPENVSVSKSQAYHKHCNAEHVKRMVAKRNGATS